MQIALDGTLAPSVTIVLMTDHPMKIYREAAGVTLKALAARTDTSEATLSRIEQRKQVPSMSLVARLKAETGLSADAFLPPTHDHASPELT